MFGSSQDDQFANSVHDAGAVGKGAGFWPIIILVNCSFLIFGIWAYFSELEEVATGLGRVIPSTQLQVVQSLEGGIVRSVAVAEGDIVEKDQILAQIDDTGFSSQLGELRRKELALLAERTRLVAESNSAREITFPPELEQENSASVEAEKLVFASRYQQLDAELNVLENRLAQRRADLVELQAQRKKLEAVLGPQRREKELLDKMVKRRAVPEIEYLRFESRLAELEGDLEIVNASVPRVEASILEAENQIESTKNTYKLSAFERLAKVQAELAVVEQSLRAAADRVSRTQLRAPVRGVINKINVTTIGAVVQPGHELIEIVPLDDGLLIETDIRPQDVAFVRPGEKATVKLTAYDYLIYGSLTGEVTRIAADTTSDARGDKYYRVMVRTQKNYIGDQEDKLPVIPGMVATVDIQTGKNTVLSYIMKPLLRAKSESFRER